MNDQKQLWNNKHAAGEHEQWSDKPRTFAIEIAKDLEPGASILELGCGVGSDARYFAEQGFDILATDFSEVVIEQNKKRSHTQNLKLAVLDMTEQFPYKTDSFNAVYAYLSLHYYDTAQTQAIFQEIFRVLKPRGKLYFVCKSIHDPKYGEGEKIGQDIFARKGHIRHFFSKEYVENLAHNDFEVIRLKETSATFVGEESAFIECWAIKKEVS